ncbi:carbohydrate ABC transporter substrate-binding protein (CUT1 family) [Crenobacter luteus]|uniref:ABC transporter substrate-binding protein n=1 Tax=Crenobacter luteus TaxID=1452487 RepID=UPI00104AA01F|nr:ABC transporter substrate-binding protein [Crenobacter luteus]TCP08464.1 carbohydrate ABC transporter substrate-binding protein (CUT1 family) [Crenobacter luteus]
MKTRMTVLTVAAALGAAAGTAGAATLKISCGAVGQELELCKQSASQWAKKTGHQVEVVATPNDSNERLALYQQILASGSDKIDVFQIDVVWPGILARHLVDLRPYVKGAEKQHFPSIVANNTVAGKLVAMPWYTDAGLLYYRKDLLDKYKLKAPTTWDELAAAAKTVQDAERAAGNDKLWGYVWQGRAYEGLSCDALEWVASHNGGTVVDATGKVTINNANAARALSTAASWVGTISPKAVLNYGEEEARGVFQAGNAVFMRNWPYAWALAQKTDSQVKGKVGVMPLPKGGAAGRNAATLGGWQLGVSRYSKNPKLAAELVAYLTSAEVQKMRAIKSSYNPTIPALYQDAEVVRANPFMAALYTTFSSAVARPSSVTASKYNQVSNQFWNASHDVLSGKSDAKSALARLEFSLKRLAPAGNWK